jgi:hypothetical protein
MNYSLLIIGDSKVDGDGGDVITQIFRLSIVMS